MPLIGLACIGLNVSDLDGRVEKLGGSQANTALVSEQVTVARRNSQPFRKQDLGKARGPGWTERSSLPTTSLFKLACLSQITHFWSLSAVY